MATPQDYEVYRRVWPKWAEICLPSTNGRILLCSPDKVQFSITQLFYANHLLMQRSESEWNLNSPWLEDPVDVIIACNVFHYSYDPIKWFDNCFSACKFLWLQDLFSRPRGHNGTELSKDDPSDMTRYGLGGVFSSNVPVDTAFDLAMYKDRLLAYEVYDAGSFRECKALINFVACFRGDLA